MFKAELLNDSFVKSTCQLVIRCQAENIHLECCFTSCCKIGGFWNKNFMEHPIKRFGFYCELFLTLWGQVHWLTLLSNLSINAPLKSLEFRVGLCKFIDRSPKFGSNFESTTWQVRKFRHCLIWATFSPSLNPCSYYISYYNF